jgi:hypothetical protein
MNEQHGEPNVILQPDGIQPVQPETIVFREFN